MEMVSDASIWLASFVPDDVNHLRADQFVLDVWQGAHDIVVPTIFLTEVICGVSRRYRHFEADRIFLDNVEQELSASSYIFWKTVDSPLARDAAAIGAMYELRGMDALYAATAIYYDVPLLTHDKEFNRTKDILQILRLEDVVGI